MVSQKGALYDDDSHNRGDESFSDKSQGSKTTNASSLATAVSDSANHGEGMELAVGRCRDPYSRAEVQRSLGDLYGGPYMQAYRA
jgi:hypothetical protein